MNSNWQTIAGISLQLATGLLIMLRQFLREYFEEQANSMGQAAARFLNLIAGPPIDRWRRTIIVGFIGVAFALVAMYSYMAITGEIKDVLARTLGAVLAPMLVLSIFYGVYLRSLEATAHRLAEFKPLRYATNKSSTDYARTIRDANVILLVTSLAILVGFGFLGTYLGSSASSASTLHAVNIAITAIIVILLVLLIYPLLMLSCIYLGTLLVLNSFYLLGQKPWIFWISCLAIWSLGGAFLLWGA